MNKYGNNIIYPFTGTMVGGSYVVAATQASLLHATGQWRVRIVLPADGENADVFRRRNIETEFYGLPEYMIKIIRSPAGWRQKLITLPVHLWIAIKAFGILLKRRPDLVVVHDRRTLLSWGVAARLLRVPVIWHVHQEKGEKIRDWFRLKIPSALVLNSNATLGRFKAFKRIPTHLVVHNSINTDIYSPSLDKASDKMSWKLNTKAITVGYVGALVPRKRPEWLFEAAEYFRQNKLSAQVVLAGQDMSGGRYMHMLEDQYLQAVNEGYLVYLGYTNKVPSLMRALDIFAMPSYQESFGLVYGEAMASGVPAIGCNIGGVPEVIVNDVTGYLVDNDNKIEFIEKLSALITDSQSRSEMAGRGRRHIIDNFSEGKMQEKIDNYYQSIIKGVIL